MRSDERSCKTVDVLWGTAEIANIWQFLHNQHFSLLQIFWKVWDLSVVWEGKPCGYTIPSWKRKLESPLTRAHICPDKPNTSGHNINTFLLWWNLFSAMYRTKSIIGKVDLGSVNSKQTVFQSVAEYVQTSWSVAFVSGKSTASILSKDVLLKE